MAGRHESKKGKRAKENSKRKQGIEGRKSTGGGGGRRTQSSTAAAYAEVAAETEVY